MSAGPEVNGKDGIYDWWSFWYLVCQFFSLGWCISLVCNPLKFCIIKLGDLFVSFIYQVAYFLYLPIPTQ